MTRRSRRWRTSIAPARDVLYLGRGPDYPLALEGALKLKEISYIHAEGYAAGEMKHGPIALIDDVVPVIVLAPSGPLFEKTVSNMQEVRARGGKIVLISDAKGIAEAGEGCMATIEMPEVHPLIAPLVYAVPVQLLAYHVAVAQRHRRRPAAQPGEERDGRISGGLGRYFLGFELSNVPAQSLVQEIDHRPDPRRVPHSFMGEEPQHALVVASRWQATDEVCLRVGDDTGQDGNPEAGPDARQEPARGRVMHCDLLFQPEYLQPGLVMDPEIAASAADEGVPLQLGERSRHSMAGCIVAAAVEGPVVDAHLTADQSGRLVGSLGAAKRNVGFTGAEVADRLRRVEFDEDFRMSLVKLPEERREKRDRINFFGGDFHGAAEIARLC